LRADCVRVAGRDQCEDRDSGENPRLDCGTGPGSTGVRVAEPGVWLGLQQCCRRGGPASTGSQTQKRRHVRLLVRVRRILTRMRPAALQCRPAARPLAVTEYWRPGPAAAARPLAARYRRPAGPRPGQATGSTGGPATVTGSTGGPARRPGHWQYWRPGDWQYRRPGPAAAQSRWRPP
jgi:hypothetical protein